MQIAALLSDLKSLSACDHESALALVTVHHHLQQQQQKQRPSQPDAAASYSSAATTTTPSPSGTKLSPNPDLERAKDLIALHYSVNSSPSSDVIDAGLRQARADVNAVLVELYRRSPRT